MRAHCWLCAARMSGFLRWLRQVAREYHNRLLDREIAARTIAMCVFKMCMLWQSTHTTHTHTHPKSSFLDKRQSRWPTRARWDEIFEDPQTRRRAENRTLLTTARIFAHHHTARKIIFGHRSIGILRREDGCTYVWWTRCFCCIYCCSLYDGFCLFEIHQT